MREWTVEIDSSPGVADSDAVLERFHEAITADAIALGAAASIDTETGVIGATFQVEAPTATEAGRVGGQVFAAALELAGVAAEARDPWMVKITAEPERAHAAA